MKRDRVIFRQLGALALSCGCLASASSVYATDPVALAVAEFDYADSSGEATDQSEAHAGRLQDFARLIRHELSASGKYQIVTIACPQSHCSAGTMDAGSLTDAARRSGARLLLYGGIHKMSTLVQFGKAQIVDLETDKLVFDRTITFRGDNDEAWQRAGEFLAEDLLSKGPAPAQP
jgi:hypothetical protein